MFLDYRKETSRTNVASLKHHNADGRRYQRANLRWWLCPLTIQQEGLVLKAVDNHTTTSSNPQMTQHKSLPPFEETQSGVQLSSFEQFIASHTSSECLRLNPPQLL